MAAALLTPPITDSDVDALHGGNENMPSASSAEQPLLLVQTPYKQLFPSIANLAVQNNLDELIKFAEASDLTVSLSASFFLLYSSIIPRLSQRATSTSLDCCSLLLSFFRTL